MTVGRSATGSTPTITLPPSTSSYAAAPLVRPITLPPTTSGRTSRSCHAILDQLGKPRSLIRHVEDRPGHDRRYAIDTTRITNELGWRPRRDWQPDADDTVDWYVANPEWWQAIRLRDPRFQEFYDRQYVHRLAVGTVSRQS